MKVYNTYFQDYELIYNVGIFSSRELAEESAKHYYENNNKISYTRRDGTKYWYIEFDDLYIDEVILDEYHTKNLSTLAKIMKEEDDKVE